MVTLTLFAGTDDQLLNVSNAGFWRVSTRIKLDSPILQSGLGWASGVPFLKYLLIGAIILN